MNILQGSFRDPSGFVFEREGIIYRCVNHSYKTNYDHLIASGLYQKLVDSRLLVPHEEVSPIGQECKSAYKILEPKQIPFISYPYEWSFSQLKDAACAMLKVQLMSLEHGMSLKDASAFNIQFIDSQCVLIDTLSFEKYSEGCPWPAYRQFCQHFLAPLALMSKVDVRLGLLMRCYIDGLPLDLSSSLLPWYSYVSAGLFLHIYLHARAQHKYTSGSAHMQKRRMNRISFIALINSLLSCVKKQQWKPYRSFWNTYYKTHSYTPRATASKANAIHEWLNALPYCPHIVWDIGANTGYYSRHMLDISSHTISFDSDPSCVEANYLEARKKKEKLLPILMDFTNPTSGMGWAGSERLSLADRGPADVVLALALVHHLAIANNLPMEKIASFFSKIGKLLVIEFVPKSDMQVKKLLTNRDDIFPSYTKEHFKASFLQYYSLEQERCIDDSERTLYMMRKK